MIIHTPVTLLYVCTQRTATQTVEGGTRVISPVLPVSSARTPRTLMPRTYVQPWARYAVMTASSRVMAASMPTQHASCIYTADTTITSINFQPQFLSFFSKLKGFIICSIIISFDNLHIFNRTIKYMVYHDNA